MPNDVYRAAIDGLAALVPPKAARRLVDDSLRATRRTADDVSVAAMRRLLLGPIRQELAGVLPPSAIGAGLKKIAAELHAESPQRRRWWRPGRARSEEPRSIDPIGDDELDEAAAGEPQAAMSVPMPALSAASKAAATSGPASAVRSSMIAQVTPAERAEIEAAVVEAAPRETHAGGEGSRASTATPPRNTAPGAKPALPKLDATLLARALKAFGELETVQQVVAVSGGELLSANGEGVDALQLPALTHATRRLLDRAGRLNVFALERPTGAMFLFPLSGGELVVLTKPKVNFGAVLAARAALEEAA